MLTHGMTKTPTHRTWAMMKQRCKNSKAPYYEYYGGRGITYDPRWESFENFLTDMGKRPKGLTLERIDNNGNYCKSNCKWATWEEQSHNKRKYKTTNPLLGVAYDKSRPRWLAYSEQFNGRRVYLYRGPDFFEAVCRRKSYERKQRETSLD